MKIPHYSELKRHTDSALAVAREPKKAILAYAGITTGLGLLVTVFTVLMDQKIAGTGGLSNMGLRSVLSTVQSILPLAQSLVLLCVELGYISAAMRFARKQYADHTDLRTGFRLLAPLLRLTLLKSALFFLILLAVCNIIPQLYLMTPFGRPLLDLLTPMVASGAVLDDATILSLLGPMLPMLAVVLVVYGLIAIPLLYRFRMANYCLVDRPREGARAALRGSRQMMRGNCIALLKVDLHFWWYYLLSFLASLICYGDQLLPLAGIHLPISSTAAYFIFYAFYLVIQFFLFLCFRNRLEVTYATAYDTICPRDESNTVTLGNIFTM